MLHAEMDMMSNLVNGAFELCKLSSSDEQLELEPLASLGKLSFERHELSLSKCPARVEGWARGISGESVAFGK